MQLSKLLQIYLKSVMLQTRVNRSIFMAFMVVFGETLKSIKAQHPAKCFSVDQCDSICVGPVYRDFLMAWGNNHFLSLSWLDLQLTNNHTTTTVLLATTAGDSQQHHIIASLIRAWLVSSEHTAAVNQYELSVSPAIV